jgi:hypothetical protein
VCVVAYVSGHGFGHAAREVEILRRLPADIPLVVKSASPEWFWRQEVRRPFEFVADAFDVGCVQHDSIRIDNSATLAAWQAVDARNREREGAEAEDLRRRGARVVVSDVAAFPLVLADRLGIPAVLIANFTWADIYAEFIGEEPGFAAVVEDLTEQYRRTTLCLDTDLALPMPYLPRKERVGLVCRPGHPRRDELLAHLGPAAAVGKRLALVYLGSWGYPLAYERLESFRDWHFLSLDAPPVPVANWSVVPRDLMGHPDMVASVDLVVSKPGYGIVAECLSLGTPFLYCPRPGFAEYAAMDAVLSAWPGGLPVSQEAFLSLEWGDLLARVPDRTDVPAFSVNGGPRSAHIIADFYTNNTIA